MRKVCARKKHVLGWDVCMYVCMYVDLCMTRVCVYALLVLLWARGRGRGGGVGGESEGEGRGWGGGEGT